MESRRHIARLYFRCGVAGFQFAYWQVSQILVIRRPTERHVAALIGGNRCTVEMHIGEALTQPLEGVGNFFGLHEGNAVLCHDDAAIRQTALAARIEFRGEQDGARPNRVR